MPITKEELDIIEEYLSSKKKPEPDTTGDKQELSLFGKITTPISKLVTGKSFVERMNYPFERKQEELLKEESSKAARGEKPMGAFGFFMKQLPAATQQVLTQQADLTPLDIGVMAASFGLGKVKIPTKAGQAVRLGDIATNVKVGKGFKEGVEELGRYHKTLKTMAPFSSRGIPVEAKTQASLTLDGNLLLSKGNKTSSINLSKYSEETQKGIVRIINEFPDRKSVV